MQKFGFLTRRKRKKEPSTDYRFPFERGEDTAFVDPYMEAASIIHENRIFQVRFFISGSEARLVYRRPEFNRYAEVRTKGFGPDKPGDQFGGKVAKMLLYGQYLIVFNGLMKEPVEVSILETIQGKQARNIRNGKNLRFEDTTSLKPMSSYVFYIPSRDPQN